MKRLNGYEFVPNFDESQCYALGVLWADGWLVSPKICRAKRLGLDIIYEDFEDFKESLSTLGKLYFKSRKRKNRKLQMTSRISNKGLCEWLFNIEFKNKSNISPNKLLEFIPQEFTKDFIRGWIDGDGCFYINVKRSMSQFIIAGTYNQDWSSFTRILDMIDIKTYKVVQKKQIQNGKENRGSIIRITNRKDITKLFYYIYNDPKHFLKRKYEKCLQIVNF